MISSNDFDPQKVTSIVAIDLEKSSTQGDKEGPFEPLKYGSFKDRFPGLQERIKSPEGLKEIYYPPCKAATTCGKISHFFKTTIQGTFLQTYDAHLMQVMKKKEISEPSDLKSTSKAIAAARASANITGKTILGVSVVGSVVGTAAGGITGLVFGLGGALATGGDLKPESGAYVGACMGCAVAGGICTAGALVGSALIAATEPELSGGERLGVVATGTGIAFALSMYTASPIINAGQSVSEFKYLEAGDTRGFLYLHCLGMPT